MGKVSGGCFITLWIGLVTKNGILIVEFANQRRSRDPDLLTAARKAAIARFRPVLMTSLSTILGILPLALALGAGSESRVSMGIAVIGGLLVGSALTLYVVPAVYSFLASEHVDEVGIEAAMDSPPRSSPVVGEAASVT